MDNNISTDKQLVSSIRNTEWIDLSTGHNTLRTSVEEQINSACVVKNDTSPIMVKGAFGIGKTATLHYMFHYAWTKLGVPAFLLNLEDVIVEIKKYLAENDLEKLPNKDVSKLIGDSLSAQIEILENSNSDEIEGNQIYFPSFDQGNLTEYLSKFKQAKLHTTDNGGYKDEELPLFDVQKIKEVINGENRYLLLIDEFEAKYQELKGLIESSGGGMLRHFFDDVTSISSTNYYCIIGNGPASGYELNQDLKEKSDSNAAEQRRLFVKQLQMPTVASLSKTFLKGYPKEHINFIWWLSRSRPGQIKKLKDNLQSINELKEHNYIQFLNENKVLNEPLDDVGESNVTFLKTGLFENLPINLKDIIKDLLINLGPIELDIQDEKLKEQLSENKELFYASTSTTKASDIINVLQEDIIKIRDKSNKYSQVNFDSLHIYIDLILSSISNENDEIVFGVINKDVDEYLSKNFLTPLFSNLYDFITIYEDEHDKRIKTLLDFILELINKSENDDVDSVFPACFDLFEEGSVKLKREAKIMLQLNLNTIRETIEQPIGSPKLPYKAEPLKSKISEVGTIESIFIWSKNDNEEIIVIPNYENEELLESYLEALKRYFEENWNERKNYFGNGELISNVVYLEENDKIDEFKEWLCFDDDKEELPYKLKRFDVKHIESYQIHNAQRISDFISSLTEIATVGLYDEDIEEKDLKKYSDNDDDNIIRIDKIVDVILNASWTESKQTRRTIEYYKDLLLVGDNSVLNQISLEAQKSYKDEIEEYVSDIEKIKNYSYSIKLSDKDHLETVFSSPSRRFISFSLAQNENLDEKLIEILHNIQDLKLYPDDDKEDLSLIGYNGFAKKHKKDLHRFVNDFHQTDKLTKGIKKYLDLFSEYTEANTVEEINDLLSEENLLHKSYLNHIGISTYKNYFFDGLYLNILSDRIEDSEVFKTNLLSDLDKRKSELRELSTELLDISENLKDLTNKKDDFIVVNDIDNFYTKAIIPFTLYLEQNFSISTLIIGKYIETTIDRKIITIKEFISDTKKLESSLQSYKRKIEDKQNTINDLYAIDSLNTKLFKEKYSTPRNGNYLYSRLFVESIKKLGGGDTYDKIFEQKYKPTETFWIKNDDVKAFQSTLKSSFDNNLSTMNEIIENLQSISDDVENMRVVENSILDLIKVEDNE